MNERTKSILTTLISVVFFIVCVALVIMGQKNVGVQGLMVMLLGLAGLLIVITENLSESLEYEYSL